MSKDFLDRYPTEISPIDKDEEIKTILATLMAKALRDSAIMRRQLNWNHGELVCDEALISAIKYEISVINLSELHLDEIGEYGRSLNEILESILRKSSNPQLRTLVEKMDCAYNEEQTKFEQSEEYTEQKEFYLRLRKEEEGVADKLAQAQFFWRYHCSIQELPGGDIKLHHMRSCDCKPILPPHDKKIIMKDGNIAVKEEAKEGTKETDDPLQV